MFHLKPSDIRYSQDSISNRFDAKCNHSHKTIGETLDDICTNRCTVYNITTIRVVLHDGNWVTADNRRLWVFRQLERLGKCNEIPVRQVAFIPEAKLTSENKGTSVRVRGNPGGLWFRKPTPKPIKARPEVERRSFSSSPTTNRTASYTTPTSHVTGRTPYPASRYTVAPADTSTFGHNDHMTYTGSRSTSSYSGPASSTSPYDDRRSRSVYTASPYTNHYMDKDDTSCCVIL